MYRDNTLIPSEAIRLLALGVLATRERPYAELAHEVFKIEGLIEPVGLAAAPARAEAESEAETPLRITEAGWAELMRLLTSNVRAPVSDINKLIITLKMRFLHLLEPAERRLQAEILTEMCERQLVRLTGLRAGLD